MQSHCRLTYKRALWCERSRYFFAACRCVILLPKYMLFLCCRWGAICCECVRLAIENSHLSPEAKQERPSALRRALQVAPENFHSPNLTRGSSSWYWPTPQVDNDAQTHPLLRIWCPICALSCGVSGSTLELAWMVGTKMCPALRINEQGLPSSSRNMTNYDLH